MLVDASAYGAPSGLPVDVSDPNVSHDGTRVVFAGRSEEEPSWRIYEINADGSNLRQVTRSDRVMELSGYGDNAQFFETYDDTDPCYLPDGRICFVSTRSPGLAPAGRVRSTNLFVVNASGTDTHRITSERFGADTPAVDPVSSQIVYSRWWLTVPSEIPTPAAPPPATNSRRPAYYGPPPEPPLPPLNAVLGGIAPADFQGVNNWFLASINPDGSGMGMFNGFGMDRA